MLKACPHCQRKLRPIEAYWLLNLRRLNCRQCNSVLVPRWQSHQASPIKRIFSSVAWGAPAIICMVGVWFYPEYWWGFMLSLVSFHAAALTIICWRGYYHVGLKEG